MKILTLDIKSYVASCCRSVSTLSDLLRFPVPSASLIFALAAIILLAAKLGLAEDCKAAAKKFGQLGSRTASGSIDRQDELSEILKLCPSLKNVRFQLAALQLEAGDIDAASASAEGLEEESDSIEALLLLAQISIRRNNFDKADRLLGKALKKDSGSISVLQTKSLLQFSRGDVEAAERSIRKALQLSPGSGELFYNLGVMLQKVGRKGEALSAFKAAVRNDDTLAPAWQAITSLALSQADIRMAVDAAAKAVLHRPGDADSWFLQYRAFRASGRQKDALASLAKAETIAGDAPRIVAARAMLEADSGDPLKAKSLIEPLLESKPAGAAGDSRLFSIRSAYAWILMQNGEFQSASDTLRELATEQPKNTTILINLAVAQKNLGNKSTAISLLERALEIEPENEAARRNLDVLKE